MLERSIRYLVMAAIVSSIFSVAAYSILFGLAVLLWAIQAFRERRLILKAPPFFKAILLFCLATVLAMVFSTDPWESLPQAVRLLRFLPVLWVFTYFSKEDVWSTIGFLLIGLLASALLALLQYFWLMDVDLMNRIRGFMSHWMTFSGQIMVVCVVAFGILLLSLGRRRELPGWERLSSGFYRVALVILLAVWGAALLLTFTRSAWIGVVAGMVSIVLIWNWKMIFPGIVLLCVGFALLPSDFKDRLYSGLDLSDTTSQGRLELAMTGLKMIQDHPLTGVGPRMVAPLASKYASRFEEDQNFPAWLYQHLHNSPLQVAAETGLIGLFAWLYLWFTLFRQLLRLELQRADLEFQGYLAVSIAIGTLVAFLIAGLLEYNFGDSEILTLVLFLVTSAYVCNRANASA